MSRRLSAVAPFGLTIVILLSALLLIGGCERDPQPTSPTSDKIVDGGQLPVPIVVRTEDGVSQETARILVDRLSPSVLAAAEYAVVGRAPDDLVHPFLIAVQLQDQAGRPATNLYNVGMDKQSVELVASLRPDTRGDVTVIAGDGEVVAVVKGDEVIPVGGAKINLKAICVALTWLAGSFVCTALAYWHVAAGIVCGAIHAFIGYFC